MDNHFKTRGPYAHSSLTSSLRRKAVSGSLPNRGLHYVPTSDQARTLYEKAKDQFDREKRPPPLIEENYAGRIRFMRKNNPRYRSVKTQSSSQRLTFKGKPSQKTPSIFKSSILKARNLLHQFFKRV